MPWRVVVRVPVPVRRERYTVTRIFGGSGSSSPVRNDGGLRALAAASHLYPALLRLEQYGWIASRWGASENNRKAKFYSLTRAGRKQLAREEASWEQISAVINSILKATS